MLAFPGMTSTGPYQKNCQRERQWMGLSWELSSLTIGVILITFTRSIWQLSYSYVLMRVAGSRKLVLAGQDGDAHV